jgi:hypothetical protein
MKCHDADKSTQCRYLLGPTEPICFEKCRGVTPGKDGKWPEHKCASYSETEITNDKK